MPRAHWLPTSAAPPQGTKDPGCWNIWLLPATSPTQIKLFKNFFLFYPLNLFLFIFGCTGSSLLCRLSLVVVSRGYSSSRCSGFSLQWLLLLQSPSFGVHELQKLWCMGLSVPWNVGSSWTRDQTHVPCIGKQILYYWATREVWKLFSIVKCQTWKVNCLRECIICTQSMGPQFSPGCFFSKRQNF